MPCNPTIPAYSSVLLNNSRASCSCSEEEVDVTTPPTPPTSVDSVQDLSSPETPQIDRACASSSFPSLSRLYGLDQQYRRVLVEQLYGGMKCLPQMTTYSDGGVQRIRDVDDGLFKLRLGILRDLAQKRIAPSTYQNAEVRKGSYKKS